MSFPSDLFGSSDEDDDFDPVQQEDSAANPAGVDMGKKLKRSLMDIELFGDESSDDEAAAATQRDSAAASEARKPKKKRLRRQTEGGDADEDEKGLEEEEEVAGDQQGKQPGEEGVAAVDNALMNSKRSRVVTDSDDEEGS